MPLPKIEHPIHEVYLKSLDKNIRFRPFLVKEEKLLLIAKEADNLNEITSTIKQIITNCCIDEIDVDNLPTFDVEMFFLHLRINSVGETAQMIHTCNNVVEDKECGHATEFDLLLKNIKYQDTEHHSSIIKLTENVGVKFNYPSISIPQAALDDKFDDGGYEIIAEYLDYIYDQDQIYKKNSVTKEELMAFFDNLTLDQVQNIKQFFLTSPRVVLEQELTCSKCQFVHNVHVEGILSFFD
jgi:hypothetical protein